MAETDQSPPTAPPRGLAAFKNHVLAHKIDVGLWATRVATILFSLGYIIPVFGNPYQSYYKALMANAATSALRLHQRLPQVQFNREFLFQFLLEDSAHYLFYSIIFLYAAPITMVLSPVFLFSILHSASYSLTLLDTLGQNSWWGARMLISFVELQSRNLLRMASFTEIFLMPLVIFLIMSGQTTLVTPFLYYRFLGLRYSSRRNPYCRTMFHELRLVMEQFAYSAKCPGMLKTMIHKVIQVVSNLAPATA
ncbi:Krueppel homolog 2 [Eurytemora carolleeae]|uniref:Krueppel homolog 2 n=1 Tax=Eurytemora carolleeae TaxID=1294199 RepID=UPI000C77BBE3|nr:Krueppel homolog 2 [Eurytemora carolleeae]|eukprot:XP_023340399.1 Krueppel homolog 2-like [Eurytemora affinis]